MISVEFVVLERAPLNQISSIPPGDIQADEGEWVNISAWSFRGEDPIPTGSWTIDGTEVDWDEHLNISLNYLGEMSYREEPYLIEYEPDQDHLFPDENGTMIWNLSVINVNRAPELISFSPLEELITIEEGQSVNLSVEVVDPDGIIPLYNWTINGEPIQINGSIMAFISNFTGENSSTGSPFDVNVAVADQEDPSLNVSVQWTLIVLDVDRMPTVNVTPAPGEVEVEHNGSMLFEVSADDPDGDVVNATWYLDGVEIRNGGNYTLSLEGENKTSDYYMALVLVLSIGSFLEQYNWTIHVLAPPEPEEPEPVPPAGVVITSPEADKEFLTNETITFEVQLTDERTMTFRWLINGSFYGGSIVSISGLAPGNYTAVLNITTEGPPPGWLELEVSFSVVKPSGGGEVEKEDKDEQFPWWIILVLVIVSVIVIGIVIFMASRRSGTYYEE
jgi:hypothetical protein